MSSVAPVPADPAAVLRGAGLRATGPRLGVLAALARLRHPTAEEISARLRPMAWPPRPYIGRWNVSNGQGSSSRCGSRPTAGFRLDTAHPVLAGVCASCRATAAAR